MVSCVDPNRILLYKQISMNYISTKYVYEKELALLKCSLGDMQTLWNWFHKSSQRCFFPASVYYTEISEAQKSTQDNKKVCISTIETQ